ncbi:MAG: hypothetical protein ACI4S9_01860 [Christensenellales bacterium]
MRFVKKLIILLMVCLMVGSLVSCGTEQEVATVNQFPQYISMHKTDSGSGSNIWNLGNPYTITESGVQEIINTIGLKGSEDRRLAIAYTFSFARYELSNTVAALEKILGYSEKYDIPVILHLDGVNYVDYYPEIWNWFDPTIAGYDPENRKNVERFDWGEGNEVKIGWRNWGTQMRVNPMINLASEEFRKMQKDCLDVLYKQVADWYKKLPVNKKYLLGGVVTGWELSTYAQNYYYEDGNSYYGSSKPDPTGTETSGSLDQATGYYASIPLGYAAAEQMGLQPEKGLLKMETIDAICLDFMEFLIDLAVENGIPANRIITHASELPKTVNYGGGHSGKASISKRINEGVTPGWSLYWDLAYEEKYVGLANGGPWAAIEMRSWGLSYDFLKSVISYRNCKLFNIYNWEAIKSDTATIEAIRQILNEI